MTRIQFKRDEEANRVGYTPGDAEPLVAWSEAQDHYHLYLGDVGATPVGGGFHVGPGEGFAPKGYKTGDYYMPMGVMNVPAGGTLVTGSVYYIPYPIGTTSGSNDFDLLCVELTVADLFGFMRMAVYNSAADGKPGDLVEESGSISTSVVGVNGYTLVGDALVLPPGVYWLAFQHTGSSQFMRHSGQALAGYISHATSAATRRSHYRETHTFGAFPATASPTTATNAAWPVLYLRGG